jgi:mono/diheme cytochrome c family protein
MPTRRLALAALVALASGAAVADGGAALFAERCAICHDAAGTGVVGFGPPLAGPAAARLQAAGGREYLTQVVVHGIAGIFESGGQRQFAAMTPAPSLSDDELAAVLNHVLASLNASALPADFRPIAAAEIAAARKVSRTPADLHKTKAALERARP